AAGKIHARSRDEQRRFVVSNGVLPSAGLLVESHPTTFNGERIDTVHLYMTPMFIEEQLRSMQIRTILLIFAVDVMLIVFVYLVLFPTVVRPLTSIERYAVAVSAGDESKAAPTVAGSASELEGLPSLI